MSTKHLELIRNLGVYIYFPEKKVNLEARHYAADVLTAGLAELGIDVYSNAEEPIFKYCPVDQCRCAVAIFYITQDVFSTQLMEAIEAFAHPRKFILSMSDSANTMLTAPTVPSLLSHENRFLRVHGRRIPWAFGLSTRRIADGAEHLKPMEERRPSIVRCFRPSLNQSVRDCMDLVLLPQLEKHFDIDRTVSVPGYYERLGSSTGCLAYGGHVVSDLSKNGYFGQQAGYQAMSQVIVFERDPLIMRWDSWRLWESFASGCLTFNLDMEKYGLLLPDMPRPWVDYIPVDFDDPRGTVEHLMDLKSSWGAIATSGREWAIAHFGPRATAERFLSLVG